EAAQRGLSEVEPRLGQLTVRLLGPQDRLTLRLDELDWPLAVVGVAAPADPGPHVLHALRDDHEVARAEVRVPEGGAAQVELTIPPLPAVTPGHGRSGQPVVPPPGGDVTGEAWFWILIGGGVAAVGAAVTILLVVMLSGTGSPVAGNLMPGVLEFGG
ncbi:MAG: hypothetical protein K8H88_18500, partial [Sandaracinaceae bacterium]|nr:hypothetical protein [Sandaracinaceae bacterium]